MSTRAKGEGALPGGISPADLLQRVGPPMLARPGDVATFRGRGQHVFEVKYDGYRALAAVAGGRVALMSRNRKDLTARFPAICRSVAGIGVREAVFDGEVFVPGPTGGGIFQALLGDATAAEFVIFDLLWLAGRDLRQQSLDERRALLDATLRNIAPPIRLAERISGDESSAISRARERGLEGLIAKRRESTYRGTRSADWIKLKFQQSQEVAIVGYLPISTGQNAIGALLGAVHDGRGFRFVGKIGTGLKDSLRADLWRWLERRRIDEPPVEDPPAIRDVRWTEPRMVAQIRFAEWTADGKLRHPSFLGIRSDKTPEECVRE